jgi:hypothetical protein
MKKAWNVGVVTVVILGAIALYSITKGNIIDEISLGKDHKD